MPNNKNKKILAIDPGTRTMGIAFFDDERLIYHGVKVIEKKGSSHETLKECRKIILRLIRDLRPNILAFEKTFFANNKNSNPLNFLMDEIKAIGKRKGLKVISYAPSTIKKAICGNGRATKKEVAKTVISRYPELKVYLTQDRAWKERYHENMFDAVAVGVVLLQLEFPF